MKRRQVLAGAAALAARPVLAQPAIGGASKVLSFVPTTNPPSYDPAFNPAQATRTLGLMIYETLYTRDMHLNPHPHMVEGHLVEDGGKRWTMTLREGLWFHDGTPVRARDCVASIKRWMARDPVGGFINERMDALEAPNDRTLVWRLRQPFPFLPNALAKTQPTPAIMPERLCADPWKQAPECIGSGPFRWVASEFVTGSRAVMAKFENYVPRPEKVEYGWGGYHVKVDRVEWRIIPDPATAAGALATGEVDWVELPLPDLLPMLRKTPDVVVRRIDTHGVFPVLRPNFIHGPTANVAVRRAMLAAINQVDEMTALMGEDRDGYRAPIGFFIPESEAASDAGMDLLRNPPGVAAIQRMLKEGGYNGERIVFMHPTDPPAYDVLCSVAEGAFRRVGLDIDVQTTDWGTVTARRVSKEPLEKGGWSIFPSGFPPVDYANPVLAGGLRTNGKDAWVGWPENARIEALRSAWIDSPDPAEQKRLAAQIQLECFNYVPYIPLGQYLPAGAWRSNITGQLRGPAPVFWNVSKA
ncbi:ABC transporter substrate-binding protein [Rhodopila sp.]|jgi:peptide/nickel transport system substrate-binding protein|uniref:ABC transporter substrate-binding protein n=1 Tax=Rhodopila sp. TaxID=2480087 RepID=UPI002D0C527C|nr:ABC transporter substrate-binding protein [Rhodopila sp.]HVZ10015.1 ABC transporter substrate-binding protein [Rhodopila sp.]